MTSQHGLLTISMHILPNTSRSKDNQSVKIGQLLTWKKMFLKNHTQNVVEKLFQDPFPKRQNWAYFWISSVRFYTAGFYCMLS